jgi:hypothetical protein
MPTLQELLIKHNIKVEENASSGPRAKLLIQADRMLNKLKTYTDAKQLDGLSTQYWWSPQAVNGKRRVGMRYSSKVVEKSSVFADNTVDAVTKAVQDFKNLIEDSDDATWAGEEARRAKK